MIPPIAGASSSGKRPIVRTTRAAVAFGEDLDGGVVVARPTLDDGIDGQPLVSAEEGRKRIIVCLEAERAVAEGREIALRF
jgi:hypothetical protein